MCVKVENIPSEVLGTEVSMTLSCAHSCYCVITLSYTLAFHCVCD